MPRSTGHVAIYIPIMLSNTENENLQENGSLQEDFNNDIIKFPPELENSISKILKANDPIDSNDFIPIEYLNKMLPNGKRIKVLLCFLKNIVLNF